MKKEYNFINYPAMLEIIKGSIKRKTDMITLDYFGHYDGKILMISVTRYTAGTTYLVSAFLGEEDISNHLKLHLAPYMLSGSGVKIKTQP